MSLAKATASLLRDLKNGRFEIAPPRRAYADLPLHACIKKHLKQRGGTFIEAGANDGLAYSNTAYLERYQGWRGLLIEPIPHLAATCRRNRRAITLAAALVGPERNGATVEIAYANLMSTLVDLPGECARSHPQRGHQWVRSEMRDRTYHVPARSLSSILDELRLPPVDFLSLDVEHAEFEALSGLDLTRHRPRFMLIETRDLSRLRATLERSGYALVEAATDQDFLFTDADGAR